jgi:antitoxin component YwqK of YwqJK toxin-antitoxin module
MKKIILTISAVAAFFVVNAQRTVTENWPNGSKKSQGTVIGDANIAPNDSKEDQARKMSSVAKDGKWTTWFENGTLHSEEFYDKGTMTGTWKSLYENGKTESEINFATGKAVFYYPNGTINSEGNMSNGMIQKGKWTGYHDNGNKNFEGSYNAEGKKDGVWKFYDTKGLATTEQTFNNGELIKTTDLNKK